eukprot:5473056-Pleurochrysis_carterae.AAC.1
MLKRDFRPLPVTLQRESDGSERSQRRRGRRPCYYIVCHHQRVEDRLRGPRPRGGGTAATCAAAAL